jgi:hypothetical protein
MSNEHFGKVQTTLLVAVVYFWRQPKNILEPEGGVLDHFYFDFVSEYLGHNSMFFGKCLEWLVDYLIQVKKMEIEVLYCLTDGATHFVSRFTLWNYNLLSIKFGIFFFF